MKTTIVKASELDPSLITRWRELQRQNPEQANPYFCPEYVLSVAAVRDDVRIAVIEIDGVVEGFFPYQSTDGVIAAPVGGRLSDYQGIVSAAGRHWDHAALLDACGIKIWDFDHLLASQAPAEIHCRVDDVSPLMRLDEGFDAYLAERKRAKARRIEQFRRKARKFEREIGPLAVELYSRDERAFRQVIEWKNDQCRRTGVPEFLNWGWTEAMLREIWQYDTPGFAGMLTVVRAGEEIVAAHFGMRSETVCHWWFPTYNQRFGKYSPGGIMLLKLAEAVAAEGMTQIDLGKGDDAYKPSFANGGIALVEGSLLRPSLAARKRRLATGLKAFVKESAATAPLRALYRRSKALVRRG